MTTILGAGLAGLSTAYHLGADSLIFEKHDHSGGHVHSTKINGFTWDEGPHVSFTKYDYVKKLFEESAGEGVCKNFTESLYQPFLVVGRLPGFVDERSRLQERSQAVGADRLGESIQVGLRGMRHPVPLIIVCGKHREITEFSVHAFLE